MATKPEKRDTKRRLILDAAAELFFERGYMATTINAVCDKLGVTKPFVYYYFKDKSDILEAISFEAASQTMTALRRGAEGKTTADERLKGALREFLSSHVSLFEAGSLFLKEEPYFTPEARAKMRVFARDFRDDLTALLNHALEAGLIPKQDIGLTASAIGGVVGFMYTWYRPKGPLPPEAIVERLLEIVLRTAGYQEPAKAKRRSKPAANRA